MTFRDIPPANQCFPEDLDAIADLVVNDPEASWGLAGSRDHIEALCRRYQTMVLRIASLEGEIAHVNNARQAEVLDAGAARDRADAAEARVEVYEAIARCALNFVARPDQIDLATPVSAVDARIARDLLREREAHARTRAALERALRRLEEIQQTHALDEQLRSTCRAVTGREYEVVQQDLCAELAAHPDPGPLHHASDQRPSDEPPTSPNPANREDEPCPEGECEHAYDDWPVGSVTRRDREFDQCSNCGWTEVEVTARDQRDDVEAACLDWGHMITDRIDAMLKLASSDEHWDRLVTIADEAFGIGPVEPLDATLARIERGIVEQRQRLANLEAQRAADLREAFLAGCEHCDGWVDENSRLAGELEPDERFAAEYARSKAGG